MSESPRQRIVEALVREASPERDDVAGLFVDHVLGQRLRDLLDFEEVRAISTRALTKKNLDRIFERHVIPGYARYRSAVATSTDSVGTFVPDSARDEIIKAIEKSRLPRGKWADGAIDRTLVRRLFAPVWTNLLVSFTKRLPIPGLGGGSTGAAPPTGRRSASGIAGRLSRSAKERAEKLVDAGRSVMGGLGTEVERRFSAVTKEFSDGAAEIFREALRERLKSAEGRALVAQISRQITDHVLVTAVAEIHEDADRVAVEEILRLAPSIVAHSAPRTFVQAIVRQEIDSFLTLEGDRHLRDVLSELGILDEVRTLARKHTSELFRGFLASSAFEAWLDGLLRA